MLALWPATFTTQYGIACSVWRAYSAHTHKTVSLSVSPNQCGKLEQKVLQADLRVTLMAILVCGGVHMAQANQPTNVSTPIVKS